jgi:hypothetical protein
MAEVGVTSPTFTPLACRLAAVSAAATLPIKSEPASADDDCETKERREICCDEISIRVIQLLSGKRRRGYSK